MFQSTEKRMINKCYNEIFVKLILREEGKGKRFQIFYYFIPLSIWQLPLRLSSLLVHAIFIIFFISSVKGGKIEKGYKL